MARRIRRSDCTSPGIVRRRRGRGFSYRWAQDGSRVDDPTVLRRIKDLVIPPAWTDVWICPYANGHIQAVGRDSAGRQQYLYHELWREQRDAAKHSHIVEIARRLPGVRATVGADLASRGLNRRRVLAAAVHLLDLGFFRIGGEQYAEQNGSFGLATVRREHVHVQRGGLVVFEYPAKGGRDKYQAVADPAVVKVVRALLRRSDPNPELLGYWAGRQWHDVRSDEINEHLKELFGIPVTAKDFRTWHATVLAAVGLAVSDRATTSAQRNRAVSRVMREVAEYLGNTPAVARSSYVDPRIVDRFLDGDAVTAALSDLGKQTPEGHLATEGAVEKTVLRQLEES
jgi:DNA topoisomerase I